MSAEIRPTRARDTDPYVTFPGTLLEHACIFILHATNEELWSQDDGYELDENELVQEVGGDGKNVCYHHEVTWTRSHSDALGTIIVTSVESALFFFVRAGLPHDVPSHQPLRGLLLHVPPCAS